MSIYAKQRQGRIRLTAPDDVLDVHDAASDLVTAIRAGEGPRVLECVTHRVRGHFEGDSQKYRAEDEMNSLSNHDPIAKLESVISKRRIPKKEVAAIREKIDAKINAAVEAGRAGNAPDFDRAQADVYTAVRGV